LFVLATHGFSFSVWLWISSVTMFGVSRGARVFFDAAHVLITRWPASTTTKVRLAPLA
jgi:hypothetical protein